MSNVYLYLGDNSRRVIQVMLCVPGRHSHAELAFLTSLDTLDVKQALQQLLTTNMVIMTSVPSGTTYSTFYDLSELARAYLARFHAVPAADARAITTLRKRLVAAEEQWKAGKVESPFAKECLDVQSRSHLVVAKYLREALRASRQHRLEEAEAFVVEAHSLAPEYFEVYRVDAEVKSRQGNYQAARDAYGTSVELQPESAPLRYWFGVFLMRALDDVDAALEQFGEANRLQPGMRVVRMEIVRCYLYVKRFGEARLLLDDLLGKTGSSSNGVEVGVGDLRKLHDLNLQYFQRYADQCLMKHDAVGCSNAIGDLRDAFEALPAGVIDGRIREVVRKTHPTASRCRLQLTDTNKQERLDELLEWIERCSAEVGMKGEPPVAGDQEEGRIVRLPYEKSYGFILLNRGYELFFHRDCLKEPTMWRRVCLDARVRFTVEHGPNGLQAVDVDLIADSTT